MKTAKANSLIQQISKSILKSGIDVETIVPQLQTLREMAIKEEDPLLIRSIRMAYQHLESYDAWTYPVIKPEEGEEGEETEETEEPESYTAEEHFDYLLSLWEKSDNSYNRDEMRKIANELTDF